MGVVGKPYLCMKSVVPDFSVAGCWGTAELHYSSVVYQQPFTPANGSVPAGSRHPVLTVSMEKYVRKTASSLRATPLSLSKQTMMAHTGPKDLQRLLTSSLAVMVFGSRFHDWVTILPGGFVNSFRRIQGQTWLAPYRLKAVIQHLLPRHFVGARMGFTPTGSIVSGISERDINLRMQIRPRLRALLWHHGVAFHLGFLILVFASLGVSIQNSIGRCKTTEKAWLSLITHALYPGLSWL